MLNEIPEILRIIESIDERKENRLRPKTKVNHMNTRTTKQTIQISEIMQKELSKVGEEILKLLDRNFTLPEIKEKLKIRVGSIITSGVRESYLLGFKFIENFEQRTLELNQVHMKEINDKIKNQIERFWKTTSDIIQEDIKPKKSKSKSPVASAAGPEDLLMLNAFNNYFARSAISMNFSALNQATITTRREVFKIETKKIKVTGSITVPQSIWVSERDSRVCPICLNLDGRTWAVDDKSMPRPVDDSHDGCRCRLLPFSGGKVFNA